MKTVFVRCLEDNHTGYTKGKLYKVEDNHTLDDQNHQRMLPVDDEGNPTDGWASWMARVDEEGQPVRPVKPVEPATHNDFVLACQHELLQYNHKRANTAIELLDRFAPSTEVYKAAQECLLSYLRGK